MANVFQVYIFHEVVILGLSTFIKHGCVGICASRPFQMAEDERRSKNRGSEDPVYKDGRIRERSGRSQKDFGCVSNFDSNRFIYIQLKLHRGASTGNRYDNYASEALGAAIGRGSRAPIPLH